MENYHENAHAPGEGSTTFRTTREPELKIKRVGFVGTRSPVRTPGGSTPTVRIWLLRLANCYVTDPRGCEDALSPSCGRRLQAAHNAMRLLVSRLAVRQSTVPLGNRSLPTWLRHSAAYCKENEKKASPSTLLFHRARLNRA
jgi:hypothetical protein